MRKTKLLISSSFILFGFLLLSSCDKKDAILVNRRTATPERVEEIKEEQKERERQLDPLNRLVNAANLDLSDDDYSYLVDILRHLNAQGDDRSHLINILRHLNAQDDNRDDDQNYDRTDLINILRHLNAQGDDRSHLINILRHLNAQGDDRSYLIDILRRLINAHRKELEKCSHLINVLHRLDSTHIGDCSVLIDILRHLYCPVTDDRSNLIDILFNLPDDSGCLVKILGKLDLGDRRHLINILTGLNGDHIDDRSLLINILHRLDSTNIGDRSLLINILRCLDSTHIGDRSLLINILHRLDSTNIGDRSLLINILSKLDLGDCSRFIGILHRSDTRKSNKLSCSHYFIDKNNKQSYSHYLINILSNINDAHICCRSRFVNIGFVLNTIQFIKFFFVYNNISCANLTTLIPDLEAFKALSRLERRRQLLAHPEFRKAIQDQD